MSTIHNENDIAIVGMSCRFPDATTPQQYWQNLIDGHEALTSLTDDELRQSGVSEQEISHPRYVKAGMFMDGVEAFDAGFFGFSPGDARILDPQHRHFIECAWEVFEDAGYNPLIFDGAIGVFAGSGHNAYFSENVLSNKKLLDEAGYFLLRHTGNDKDFLATRVSYLLNLRGPSVNVQTACSTSLVAVHMGVQSLLNAECDMVLTGGVTIELPGRTGYLFNEGEILSPDGHCRPFDASAGGTIFGSGVGCLLLKRYDDAVTDRDNIQAIIKGTAINNDGSGKVSYLAPSVDGQIAAVSEALEIAEVEPSDVSFIECHGTGTQMGDPIEVAALASAYKTGSSHRCAIGSVKGNIGHTDTAAGVASLIKTVQALKNKQLPPTLHFQNENPGLGLENTGFYVNTDAEAWQTTNGPRRAGVSSLGVGGTNAHVILQEAALPARETRVQTPRPLLLSAKSQTALRKQSARLAEYLDENRGLALDDVAFTLSTGRAHFPYRESLTAADIDDAIARLESIENNNSTGNNKDDQAVCFMFAGGGTQYENMGIELYRKEVVYKDSIDNCLLELGRISQLDFRSVLFPDNNSPGQLSAVMKQPSYALPLLFITQYAQAQQWLSWGVKPGSLIGHSMGENTAACLAGVMTLKDALGLVVLRGQLFELVESGGMLSVSMNAADLKPLIEETGLDLAAVNAEELCVASGPNELLDKLETLLTAQEQSCQRIHINVAAHSAMLEPILAAFRQYLQSIELAPPSIPFISNVSGGWITAEQATDPDYWVSHLRSTVQFAAGLDTLRSGSTQPVLLEVGPGRTLSTLAKTHYTAADEISSVTSLPHPDDASDSREFMLDALGKVWQLGAEVDWHTYFSTTECRRVSLPTYQFDHELHWIQPGSTVAENARAIDIEDYFYQPVWQRDMVSSNSNNISGKHILLIADNSDFAEHLKDTITRIGATASTALYNNNGQFLLDEQSNADLGALVHNHFSDQGMPDIIIHAMAPGCAAEPTVDSRQQDQFRCFDTLLAIARSIGNNPPPGKLPLLVLTRQAVSLAGETISNPIQALIHGASEVINNEVPELSCSVLDLPSTETDGQYFKQLIATIETPPVATQLAIRGASRFSRTFQKVPGTSTSNDLYTGIKNNGVYLITGGHGGLGLAAAKQLANQAENIKLVLASRTGLPPRERWSEISADRQHIIDTIIEIENTGASVYNYGCDFTDANAVSGLRTDIINNIGELDGCLHTAGIAQDSLLALKPATEIEQVLAAKVDSTNIITATFDLSRMDFLGLYSSSSAFSGLIGQIDYAAANSYLDGFANYQGSIGNNNVFSVNWPAWKDTGMAADRAAQKNTTTAPVKLTGSTVDHPLLDIRTSLSENHIVYKTLLSTTNHWVLNEHRLKDGTALIPGSGFIELARAAFNDKCGNQNIVIKNAKFLQPLIVADDETLEMHVELIDPDFATNSDGCRFRIISQQSDGEIEHAIGELAPVQTETSYISIADVSARCTGDIQKFTDDDHHPNLKFGERWSALASVTYGEQEAIARLQLAPPYADDLQHYQLHPAMLDMATGGAQKLIPDINPTADLYVPVEYGTLTLTSAIPGKAVSHIRLTSTSTEPFATACFDITITDEYGNTCVEIKEFTMQKINPPSASKAGKAQAKVNPVLEKTLELGVSSDQGLAALTRIIATQPAPNVIVAPYQPLYIVEELHRVQNPTSATSELVDQAPVHNPDIDPDIPLIESTLLQHPAVESIVVRSFLNTANERQLVAWYKADDWEPITISEFRKYARLELSRSHTPHHIAELDELPLLETGEVDRASLLDPFAPVDTYVAPRTELERQLAAIWADVLGTQRVSINDNFFDIGGHSLLSIRIIVRVQQELSAELDQAKMSLLTLEQIAADIESQNPATAVPKAATPCRQNALQPDTEATAATGTATYDELIPGKSDKKPHFLKRMLGQ
ncbi:hypothetical protein AB833_26785 [Chromatiales bacterium (ex Bugula neritina AB1)]|nr:hypothetical protein AB833_26785 [Chromatiales bacterium (ex Bugula neritina AB1)]